MSAGTHTPGPWVFSFESVEPEWAVVTTSGGAVVANVNADDRQEANARLIAAAPDLLAALKEAELAIGDWGRPTSANGMTTPHPNHPLFQAMRKAYVAIAKAEGRS